MSHEPFQWIEDAQGPVALIVRGTFQPDRTVFLTKNHMEQQVGIIVHPKGAVIQAHEHRSAPRPLEGNPECLVIRRGSCEMSLYDRQRRPLGAFILRTGDTVLLLAGGHGFRMLEDCEMLETRAGSFPGDNAKVRF